MTDIADASFGLPDPGLAGTYHVTVESPLGPQQTDVELRVDGNRLEGSLELAGNRLELQNGVAGVGGFAGEGSVSLMMMRVKAVVRGRREGDRIEGSLESSMGTFAFSGERV